MLSPSTHYLIFHKSLSDISIFLILKVRELRLRDIPCPWLKTWQVGRIFYYFYVKVREEMPGEKRVKSTLHEYVAGKVT